MEKQKRNVQRYGCFLLCFAMIFTLMQVPAAAAETDHAETVRVGWYEDSYNITGENGERSGYGYEFQQSVATYTNGTYE